MGLRHYTNAAQRALRPKRRHDGWRPPSHRTQHGRCCTRSIIWDNCFVRPAVSQGGAAPSHVHSHCPQLPRWVVDRLPPQGFITAVLASMLRCAELGQNECLCIKIAHKRLRKTLPLLSLSDCTIQSLTVIAFLRKSTSADLPAPAGCPVECGLVQFMVSRTNWPCAGFNGQNLAHVQTELNGFDSNNSTHG